MQNDKWNKILTTELIFYMQKVTGETEDEQSATRFFKLLKQRVVDFSVLTALAAKWKSLNADKQASLAVHHAGLYNASRFIMLMEYMASKHEKGELE